MYDLEDAGTSNILGGVGRGFGRFPNTSVALSGGVVRDRAATAAAEAEDVPVVLESE